MKSSYDLVIIGGGPAGISAAQYAARANLSVLVLEQTALGGQALQIDILENYPGIAKGKTGYEFCEDLRRQAEDFGAKFLMSQAVSIEKKENRFTVTLDDGVKLESAAIILAAGARHKKLGIPGEEEYYGSGVSYCAVCDGSFFRKKKIFVIGGGDAACDEAQYLTRFSQDITIVHRRDRFRAQKALAEKVLKNPGITVRFNETIKQIKGIQNAGAGQVDKIASVVLEKTGPDGRGTGITSEESADAVFIYAGTEPQTQLVSGTGTLNAKTDEGGYIITDSKMACSVPGLFAAGDVRSGSFRQVVTAAGGGATAAHSAAAYIDEIRGEAY